MNVGARTSGNGGSSWGTYRRCDGGLQFLLEQKKRRCFLLFWLFCASFLLFYARAAFAAAEAAEAAADTTLGAVWMPAGEAAAGRAWRAWRADRAASAKAAEEAADAEYELEAAALLRRRWTVAGGEIPH